MIVDKTHPAGAVDGQVTRYRHLQQRRVLWVYKKKPIDRELISVSDERVAMVSIFCIH